ncbi:Maltose acetyltransferase [Agyrium rufum]|nr:Maltose acetyltransferase [Agyrium rufum]
MATGATSSDGLHRDRVEAENHTEPNSSAFTAVNIQRSPPSLLGAKVANHHEGRKPNEDEPFHRPISQPQRHPPSPNSGRSYVGLPNGQNGGKSDHLSQSPHKRKRSYPEPEEDMRTGQPYHAQAYPILQQERLRADMPPPPTRPLNEKRPSHDDGRIQSSNGVHHFESGNSLRGHGQSSNNHYEDSRQPSQPYYSHPPSPDNSDVRMVEHLRRELQGSQPQPIRTDHTRFDHDDPNSQSYASYSDQSRTPVQGPEGDRKRRKRVFSNRTKTGCLTCRKRKKKCDEAHPECNNCLRGGFLCEGYTIRSTWNKPSMQAKNQGPLLLQSKENGSYGGYVDPNSRPRAQYADDMSPDYITNTGTPLRGGTAGEGDRNMPIIVDENRDDPPSLTSPTANMRGPHGSHAWARSSQPPNGNLTAPQDSDRHASGPDYRHDSSHQDHPSRQTPSRDSMRPPKPHRPHDPVIPSSGRLPQNPHSASAVAKAALQQTSPPLHSESIASSSRRSISYRNHDSRTDRHKMLRGEYHLPHTPALMADREKCAEAVWKFNLASNPSSGFTADDRIRLFKAIMNLRPTPEPHLTEYQRQDPEPGTHGAVGDDPVVEAPFYCDYGYNINIGNNVIIGPECRISDTVAVTIGDNVQISQCVKIVCANYAVDPRDRKRGKGRQMGRSIMIEPDCWIGAGVLIMPGVKVGRSSTVAAGCVLSKDVPPFTIVAGNPQRVVRGIYDETAGTSRKRQIILQSPRSKGSRDDGLRDENLYEDYRPRREVYRGDHLREEDRPKDKSRAEEPRMEGVRGEGVRGESKLHEEIQYEVKSYVGKAPVEKTRMEMMYKEKIPV